MISHSSFGEEAGFERRVEKVLSQVSSRLGFHFTWWGFYVAGLLLQDYFVGERQGGEQPWELPL